jgi:glutamate--cysteine ligase
MSRDTVDSVPVEGWNDLVAWVEQGAKPPSAYRIGTEHEKVPFQAGSHAPVPYAGPRGIRALLEGMRQQTGWEPIHEGDDIVGLFDPVGGGAISLEPGGQFELSGAPLESLHQTEAETVAHLRQAKEVGDALGIRFLTLGMSPVWSREETPVMPRARHRIMQGYMPKVGRLGLDMMFRTATVQVNLDFSAESDMVKKYRVSLALQPLASALFANSPFSDGQPNGCLTYRSEIWRHTDAARTGNLPFVFEGGMGYERYVDYVLDVPMYFVKRGDRYIDTTGQSFRAFMAGKLPQLPGERPTLSDWANHVSTVFPDVRLKRYLEMRGADAGPLPMLTALPAFWVGLLYHGPVLDAAWDMVRDWSEEDRRHLRDEVPRLGLGAHIRRHTLRAFAAEALKLAEGGLAARAKLDASGRDESRHLAPLQEIIARDETQAQALLALWHGRWQRNLAHAFEERVF